VILDKNGNVFGTASAGGSTQCSIGCGVVYELNKAGGWSESIVHAFDGQDGEYPTAALLPGPKATLYGTTFYGGNAGAGTVFSLTPGSSGWSDRVLYSFKGTTDGSGPSGGLALDGAGRLYGTTRTYDGNNDGVAFELLPHSHGSWTDRNLHAFIKANAGQFPYAALLFSAAGVLYGTTFAGGFSQSGLVFQLTQTHGRWSETVLHKFGHDEDGNSPEGALIRDSAGNLYGTTLLGGPANAGTVYELMPTGSGAWQEQILYSFTGGKDGRFPSGTLTMDGAGNLYGTTSDGGRGGHGVVFKVTL
jgi:uncharacterized repeat protein (TIGR03803 family)